MMKLAVLVLLVGAAVASAAKLSSQRIVIPHHSLHGYGNGVSSRYFDKAETGLGLNSGLYGGLAYDGYGSLGLGYGRLGLGYGRLGYDGLGYGAGLGYGDLGLGYGYGGLRYY